MTRKKIGVDETETQQAPSMEDILAENQRLKAEKDQLAQTIATMGDLKDSDPNAVKYMTEIAAIRKLGRVDTEKITVREFADHKNISLWTKDGKRIGPMHRDNATAAFNRFYAIGVMLSTKQPTEAEIEAWKSSPEGTRIMTARAKKRESQMKTRKRGELEKILKMMATQYGVTADALMSIKKMAEIQTPTEGRKALGI